MLGTKERDQERAAKKMTRDSSSSFTYLSNPHAAPRNQPLFSQSVPLTMMSDPRVVRGNTHSLAKKVSLARTQAAEVEGKRRKQREEEEERQRQLEEGRGGGTSSSLHAPPTSSYYHFTVKPFSSSDFDLAQYLEAQDDHPARQRTVTTEVDQLLPRPVTPEYIPRKTGVDQSTQVEDVEDLFHFDEEVVPMLEVIVQKTLEQALVEVEAEEEIHALQQEVERYEKVQEEEEAWKKEQMEKLRQEAEQAEERRQDCVRRRRLEVDSKVTVAGLAMMQQILPDMIEKISEEQVKKGAWKTSDRQQFERQVLPAIFREVDTQRDAFFAAQQVLDGKWSLVLRQCSSGIVFN